MFFAKLLPREGNFFELFNQHAEHIVEAARAFSMLVQNYNDPHLREKYNQDVDNAERAADRITQEVNRLIHTTFITPIDREQIHSLINGMDDILDLLSATVRELTADAPQAAWVLYKLDGGIDHIGAGLGEAISGLEAQ